MNSASHFGPNIKIKMRHCSELKNEKKMNRRINLNPPKYIFRVKWGDRKTANFDEHMTLNDFW